jgi:hypothetical protein
MLHCVCDSWARESRPGAPGADEPHDGGRYLSLVGSNPWFHLPQDRWRNTVNVEAVARIAFAAARTMLAVTR